MTPHKLCTLACFTLQAVHHQPYVLGMTHRKSMDGADIASLSRQAPQQVPVEPGVVVEPGEGCLYVKARPCSQP